MRRCVGLCTAGRRRSWIGAAIAARCCTEVAIVPSAKNVRLEANGNFADVEHVRLGVSSSGEL
jgi:hypothetical protein